MIDIAHSRFDALEQEKKLFTTMLKHHTVEQLNFKSAPGEWTMLEVVQHLMIAERGWLRQVERGQFGTVTWISTLKMSIIRGLSARGFRARLPKNPAPPAETLDLEQVTTRWDAIRADWRDRLDQMDATAFARATIKHPFSGVIALGQAMEFMVTHVVHHRKQLERIRRAPGFPTA